MSAGKAKGAERRPLKETVDFIDQFRARIEEVVREKEESERKASEYLDRLKRLQADMENLQKITKRQMENVTKQASEGIILKLLPIMDSIRQAEQIATSKNELPREEIAVGLKMLLKQMMDVLGSEGLEEIPAAGHPFDPSQHEAVSFQETNEASENTILEEVRKGYILNGKVIRPSLVVVSRRKTSNRLQINNPVEERP